MGKVLSWSQLKSQISQLKQIKSTKTKSSTANVSNRWTSQQEQNFHLNQIKFSILAPAASEWLMLIVFLWLGKTLKKRGKKSLEVCHNLWVAQDGNDTWVQSAGSFLGLSFYRRIHAVQLLKIIEPIVKWGEDLEEKLSIIFNFLCGYRETWQRIQIGKGWKFMVWKLREA
jgi:hypothetical protein